ncbi:MAG: TetR/AcrR family transcriptional regulator [Roseovarius sp.]
MANPNATSKATRINQREGRTATREIRRQQLIDATIESISKYGISGTTMATVTRLAGLSLGIVNFHFESKEKLFEETLRYLAEEHRDYWLKEFRKDGMSAPDRLLAIVDSEFHPDICSRKKLTVWTAFYGEAGYRASYRKIMTEMDTERWETTKNLCETIIQEGGYKGLDAGAVADTLEGLHDGFCLNIMIYPGEFGVEDAKARVRAYLTTAFPKHFEMPEQPCLQG